MPILDFQSIILPLLKYTADQKEHSMRDAESYIADYFKLNSVVNLIKIVCLQKFYF